MITVYDEDGHKHEYEHCDGFQSQETGELFLTRDDVVYVIYNQGDWKRVVDNAVHEAVHAERTRIESKHSLKMVREAICVATTALNQVGLMHAADVLSDLIPDIDRQRPLGRDGKHGNLHTPWCQCPDKSDAVAPPAPER